MIAAQGYTRARVVPPRVDWSGFSIVNHRISVLYLKFWIPSGGLATFLLGGPRVLGSLGQLQNRHLSHHINIRIYTVMKINSQIYSSNLFCINFTCTALAMLRMVQGKKGMKRPRILIDWSCAVVIDIDTHTHTDRRVACVWRIGSAESNGSGRTSIGKWREIEKGAALGLGTRRQVGFRSGSGGFHPAFAHITSARGNEANTPGPLPMFSIL